MLARKVGIHCANTMKNVANKCVVEAVRDIPNETNHEMTIGHYLDNMGKLTKSMTAAKYRDPGRQRLYLKDIDCPTQWREQLVRIFPNFLFYMNENVSEKGEPGSTTYKNGVSQELQTQGIAPAGDLMSNLPPEMRADNLQLYIGHEGTYTPAHKEMCGTSSQNIMVEASSHLKDGEEDGSSIWFMTESQDRQVVSEYFLSMLGHDVEIEKHFAQVVAWKKAPFPVFVVEQKVGDLVLVPPLAPHQVWNRGNRTIKVAWNRTTVETLEFALRESLPRARMVCRDEQYRVKATIYYSLVKYYGRLRDADKIDEQNEYLDPMVHEKVWDSFRVQMLKEDFTRLAKLFADIMMDEMFSPDLPKVKDVEYLPFEGNVTCSYCRCNIFNRFLTCKSCVEELGNGDEDTYDVCMDCYAMGRSCACISNLSWVEQWRWSGLSKKYDEYKDLVSFITQDPSKWLLPLADERKKRGEKTTAEVCQEQLLRRPWNDVKNSDAAEKSDIDSNQEVEEVKRRPGGKRRKPKTQEVLSTKPCHICKKPDKPWKLAECTTCDAAYCYGSLWRAFDLKPEGIMKDPNWQCPDCRDICSCASCQRKHPYRAIYEPKGTFLGHDTKTVADSRSVESLVDFSKSNNSWLRDNDTNPKKTKRMRKLIEEAKANKIEYYRYAAQQWGMDPDAYVPEVLQGYQGYDDEKERATSNGHTPGQTPARAVERSVAASDNGLDMHRQVMSQAIDHTAPVAPMGPMAPSSPSFNNSGYNSPNPYATQTGGSSGFQPTNGNSSFVSPNELMNEPRPSYPDALASGLPEEEVRQINALRNAGLEDDGILFQASGAEADLPLNILAYPRLPHEATDDDRLTEDQTKRKRQGMLVSGDVNEAHKEIILTGQRKKLAGAKKKGPFYYTQSQLHGGHPHIVKLRVPNKKAELAEMAEIDAGRAAIRHNPGEARQRVASRGSFGGLDLDAMDLDEEEGDMVSSDVKPRREADVEVGALPRSAFAPRSPDGQSAKKMRGRSQMHPASLKPGAVPYEATVKGSARHGSGRPRKSRGPTESGEEEDDAPFEDRYPSTKGKKSTVSRPSISTSLRRGRPRKETQKKTEAVMMEISDDERNSDGELITPKKKFLHRQSAPIEIDDSPAPHPPASAPVRARKSRKSAGADPGSTGPYSNQSQSMSRSKRRQTMKPEYDHTMLPHAKRSRKSGPDGSNSIIGGGVDGSMSGAENHWDEGGDNYNQSYMSQDDHTDDDVFDTPKDRPRAQPRQSPNTFDMMQGGSDNDMAGLLDDEDDLEGEPMTIPMADDDEDFGTPISPPTPKAPTFSFDDGEESEDTGAAPSPSQQLSSEIDAQSVREKSQRQATVPYFAPRQESIESTAGSYRLADIVSSSPAKARRSMLPPPSRLPSLDYGYRMSSYSGEDPAAKKVPTADHSDDEDDDLNAKFSALRELEEEQERGHQEVERQKQEKIETQKARLAAIAKVKSDAKAAKRGERRLVKFEIGTEIAEERAKEEGERKAKENRTVVDKETAAKLRAAEAKREADAKLRAQAKAHSSAVPSDDSALEDNDEDEDTGDSDIENESMRAASPPMLSMAERRALSGKKGAFKINARSSMSIALPSLMPQQKKRYSASNLNVEDEKEEETQTPARIKKERSDTRAVEGSEFHVLP